MAIVSKNDHSKKSKNKLGYFDPTVAGIDIGARLIHVAVPDGKKGAVVEEFGTETPQLMEIANTLLKAGVKTAVMEATGVYWVPLYEILEDCGLEAVLVDAKSVKNVPGRKTDTLDCQWIQTLWSNGMLNAAYRPPRDRITLRTYLRDRQNIIKIRRDALLQIEKALQLMNIKLSSVLSDIAGVSGMDIIRAIADGEKDPHKLAAKRNSGTKREEADFIEALTGNFQEGHLHTFRRALRTYDYAANEIEVTDKLIEQELEKLPTVVSTPPPERQTKKSPIYQTARKPKKNQLNFDARTLLWQKTEIDLTAIPGIEASTALLIFAELGGFNVDAWKSHKEFSSWLKLCPGNNISGGRRRKCRSQTCVNYITQALRMAAMSAKHSKSSVGQRIRGISGRTDNMRGIKAGAHKLAILIYGMCKHGWAYHEKGEDYYEKKNKERRVKALKKLAKELGYNVAMTFAKTT